MAQIKSGMTDPKVKLLRYMDRVQGVMDGNYKPPILADVDVVQGLCNLDCDWCCQAKSRASKDPLFMSEETMKQIGPFSKDWEIKSWRIAGDSEPTLNKNLDTLLQSGHDNDIDMGLITNGTCLHTVDNLEYLTWIGISLDAATSETWSKLKHAPESMYLKMMDSIRNIRKNNPDIDITLKFVKYSSDDNVTKEDLTHKVRSEDSVNNHRDAVLLPILADNLGVNYHITEGFPKDPEYKFDKCQGTPLYGTFGADHKFYICCDRRDGAILTDDYTRDNWKELPNLWGSDKHKKIIDEIVPSDCAFCSKAWLNTIMDNIITDGKYTEDYQVRFI